MRKQGLYKSTLFFMYHNYKGKILCQFCIMIRGNVAREIKLVIKLNNIVIVASTV